VILFQISQDGRKMKKEPYISRWIFSFVALSLLWLGFTFPFPAEEVYAGLVVSALVSFWAAKYFDEFGIKCFSPARIIGIIIYTPILLWEIVKANLQVAKIVLSPKLPIKPAIVTAKSSLKSDFGKMLLANSITLTPGTLTVDIVDDTYFIHCVKIEDTSEDFATETITAKFERHIRRFAE